MIHTDRVERDAHIAAMTKVGHSVSDIAASLGICERTVERARIRLGIARTPSRRVTPEELLVARRMVDDGASCHEVSRTLGRSGGVFLRRFPECKWTRKQASEVALMAKELRSLKALP